MFGNIPCVQHDTASAEVFFSHFACFPCTLKPIFHCDAKPFALGTFASPNAKDSTFALPNTKYTNMLVSFVLGNAHFSRHPTQNPNTSQWNIGSLGTQHKTFALAMYISCFLWNMGLRLLVFRGRNTRRIFARVHVW